MIDRPLYLDFLKTWQDKRVIKVITGVRRCGKSTLFELYIRYLKEEKGIQDNQIININFENPDNENLCNYKALYDHIKSQLLPDKMNYVFFDEIQQVDQFEKAVDGLFIKPNVDLYITGSNSRFMSGELATLLSGRFVELKVLPLSFKEYVSAFDNSQTKETLFRDYLYNSSFPYTLYLPDEQSRQLYLEGIYSTIVLKDIIERYKISDASKFKSFLSFMFSNIGNPFSAKKIADTMTSMNRKITAPTIENYLDAMTSSFLMYKVDRFDIKGKKLLQLMDKYYLVDIGLRYHLLGNRKPDYGPVIENVVFLELLRRGYKVHIGKFDAYEIDFVCETPLHDIEYYQVSLSVLNPSTLQRELRPLQGTNDHYPKYLLTMDNTPVASYDGIKQIYLLDWLLGNS